MSGVLRVVESGWATTLQDLGRPGYQRQGVPVSGALDIVSLQLANSLVGNPPSMVAIEAAYTGPTLVAETYSVRMAVVGTPAKLERLPYAAAVISKPVAPNESFTLARGEALKVGTLQGGSVVYIAVEGGFDVPTVLGRPSRVHPWGHDGGRGPADSLQRSPGDHTLALALLSALALFLRHCGAAYLRQMQPSGSHLCPVPARGST